MAAYELKYTAEEIDGILESVDEKTIYDDATQSKHGLMSTTDKAKLDSLPTSQQLDSSLSGKVDKVDGKGLSTNDYDATAKGKVDAIPQNPQYTDTVYDDTALAGRVSAIEGKESGWDAKQDALVSGTNIKTVNNESILGSGNLTIQGGGEENVIESISVNGTAQTVTNKNVDIAVPTKTSDLNNDSGFITGFTETDPTVPSWAKQSSKPSYDYSEISNTPTIPVYDYIDGEGGVLGGVSFINGGDEMCYAVGEDNATGFQDKILATTDYVDNAVSTKYTKPQGGIPASDLASGVIPTVPVQDVTVGGTSVVSSGTAVIPQEVFWATYGTTTAAEVAAAEAAGKIVMCARTDYIYILHVSSSSAYYFTAPIASGITYLYLNKTSNAWSNGGLTAEKINDKVSTISGYETNETKYPNTKAVYDALPVALTTTELNNLWETAV